VTRRLARSILFACSALLCAAPAANAQVSFVKAKELYSSANYDEALAMLNTLSTRGDAAEDAAAVAMYRVLCLVAVGRSAEVDAAIDRLVSQHPLYRPPSDELSPRMRTAISSARVKTLPMMVQRRYEESKTAYDRGDFAASSVGFKWVLSALADPDISYLSGQPPLADLKTLAAGFIDLSEKALAPPPAPMTPPAAVVIAPPPTPTRDLSRIFSTDDSDVVAPVTIQQRMPSFPGALTATMAGVLEVVVNAAGGVESLRLMEPVHPRYDPILLSTAKKWQYQPARIDGVPVRYLKRIQISLTPAPAGQSGR
jgi:hypothetical protein